MSFIYNSFIFIIKTVALSILKFSNRAMHMYSIKYSGGCEVVLGCTPDFTPYIDHTDVNKRGI